MANVLVVDDSKVDQNLAEGILSVNKDIHVRFADNGVDAMNRLSQSPPDLVVTDLMMPEMDGLQLVKEVRQHHPDVPVIVMTAMSSAETAIEALQVGAASFVPKSRLADRLGNTVRQVLTLKQAAHPYREIVACLGYADIDFHLRSDLNLIPQFVDLVQRTTSSLGLCDATESIRLSLALEEALLNALVHGNLELTRHVAEHGLHPNSEAFKSRSGEKPYCDRSIRVRLKLSTDGVMFTVGDEGKGFDVASLPDDKDLSTFQDGVGRGVRLMRSFMDNVSYNEQGNEVSMTRKLSEG